MPDEPCTSPACECEVPCCEAIRGATKPKEGWKYIYTSGRRHYFRDGRSLCGKWGAIAQNGLEQGDNLHVTNCARCRLLRCQEVGRG